MGYIQESITKGIGDFIEQHLNKERQQTITEKLKEYGLDDINKTIDSVKDIAKDLFKGLF